MITVSGEERSLHMLKKDELRSVFLQRQAYEHACRDVAARSGAIYEGMFSKATPLKRGGKK